MKQSQDGLLDNRRSPKGGDSLFPRSDLCQQIDREEPDHIVDCQIADLSSWENRSYYMPYYQLETQFMADFYSYLLNINYDQSDPCYFVKQYLPSPTYLNKVVAYIQNHPLLRALAMFYQYLGDNILNSYLRQSLLSAVTHFKKDKLSLSRAISDPEELTLHRGTRMILREYSWSLATFEADIFILNERRLAQKYGSLIQQAASDFQRYILTSPPTTEEILTFRNVLDDSLDYLNLNEGGISRLRGFTSTAAYRMEEIFNPPEEDVDLPPKVTVMIFRIPPGARVLPFVHQDAMDEDEILLPHGTSVLHERTLSINHPFDLVFPTRFGKPERDPQFNCDKSVPIQEIHLFRVISDPWEVQAALNYNPLNYNLYGPCLNQVQEQTGASIEVIKRLAEEHLFSQ